MEAYLSKCYKEQLFVCVVQVEVVLHCSFVLLSDMPDVGYNISYIVLKCNYMRMYLPCMMLSILHCQQYSPVVCLFHCPVKSLMK